VISKLYQNLEKNQLASRFFRIFFALTTLLSVILGGKQ